MKSTLPSQRIESIDLLRGVVMIIMALDHCRDMIHFGALNNFDPLDLKSNTPWIFITRWITHFCAPIFVFLSGTSIFLYGSKGRTKKQVGFFLLTRGIFLIFLEILVIQPLWEFGFNLIFLQVIWAIGISMVCLSALQFLPYRILLVLGILIILGHNLLDNIVIQKPLGASIAWSMLHQTGAYPINDNITLAIPYPFLSWLGLIIIGYCFGKLFLPVVDPGYRKKILLIAGSGFIILFILLRWSNLYGDPRPWTVQNGLLYTLFDFVKVLKYPPSLLYILMTVGPGLIFLSVAERPMNGLARIILIYGKVPLFYYILHVLLIHILSWAVYFLSGHHWNQLDFGHSRDANMPQGAGSPLWIVYLIWIIAIIMLYFPCRWYGKYKSSHQNWWLSYL
jgi:uncharacterized membrane protein